MDSEWASVECVVWQHAVVGHAMSNKSMAGGSAFEHLVRWISGTFSLFIFFGACGSQDGWLSGFVCVRVC